MSSGLLPDHIEPLVDRLRAGDHLPIALPDVAAVTEVLMRSLESYFKSIDLTLYKECQDLADYIEDARTEISSLSPEHDDSAGIPRAGQELDAIVEATESATDTIMQAAEDLMSFDSDDFDEYKNHINTEVMKIFEACSFQDITGQRISKVVKTLNHVEDRVGKLITILGINNTEEAPKDAKPIIDPTSDEIDEKDLLSGPALAGEGIDQGEVDSLLNEQVDNQEHSVELEDAGITSEEIDETTINTDTTELSETELEDTEGAAEPENILSEPENVPEEELDIAEEDESVTSANITSASSDNNPKGNVKKSPADAANEETSQDDIDSLFA